MVIDHVGKKQQGVSEPSEQDRDFGRVYRWSRTVELLLRNRRDVNGKQMLTRRCQREVQGKLHSKTSPGFASREESKLN